MAEVRSTGTVSCSVYKEYFRAAGNWCCIIFVVFMFLITQGTASCTDYFLSEWSDLVESGNSKNMTNNKDNNKGFILLYTIFTVLLIVCSISRSFIFFLACYRASVNLHRKMFDTIVFATMRFFNTNPSGRILNRFSKDMGIVDEDLPYAMLDCFQIFLNLVGVIVVVCIVNYYLVIPIAGITVGMYFLRQYYLKTSRSLKRLEGITRSPMFAHLNASIQGMTTIRAHLAERVLTSEFDRHQDLHSSAWFLFIATSRAFSIWMETMCTLFTGILTFSFFIPFFKEPWYAGEVGLGITQCIILTGLFPWGMRQSTEMENLMVSVERVIEYCKIEREYQLNSDPDKKPPKNWPNEGEIVFENVNLSYSRNEEPVLKNLYLKIEANEKIGIVGRTGAGKSSLISALFRLAFVNGAIYIDKINIMDIGLHDLRRKISIIPQEPAIFTGTVRNNLDPFHEHTDDELHKILTLVDLHTGHRDVLDNVMEEGGANYSSGEKQLMCLARAILRNNKILIMDEATAKVDPQTDYLIQQAIRTSFDDCTVITIAHRLNTIMDSDKVVVMEKGQVKQFDHPYLLLKDEKGVFYGLVHQTGKTNFEKMKKIAERSYKGQRSSKLNSS